MKVRDRRTIGEWNTFGWMAVTELLASWQVHTRPGLDEGFSEQTQTAEMPRRKSFKFPARRCEQSAATTTSEE